MPENQIPATQPESGAAAGEFNFAKAEAPTPRIRRRSLKSKPGALIKNASGTPPAARELEREAPPLSAEQAAQSRAVSVAAASDAILPDVEPVKEKAKEAAPRTAETVSPVKPRQTSESPAQEVKTNGASKVAETVSVPPKVTPTVAKAPSEPAQTTPAAKTASAATPASTSATSPHGTRPATLYYSSTTRKEEAPAPMKTIPTASTTSSSSASSTTPASTSVARATTSPSRPSPTVDYRANIERQSREQKSVGNILSYVVYALIAFFVISAGLAAYGADVIFKQLHDQSVTVSDLDARYAAANKDLNAKLASTQDTLTQAQAQIARQQDVIVKQQEELNRLIATTTETDNSLKQERQARAQETANLRARVRDLENRATYQQKY